MPNTGDHLQSHRSPESYTRGKPGLEGHVVAPSHPNAPGVAFAAARRRPLATGEKILYVLNDVFCVAKVPDSVDKGITVLLPKVPNPLHWGDTRPITLSSTLLKWLGDLLRTGALLQWARRGRQGVELVTSCYHPTCYTNGA